MNVLRRIVNQELPENWGSLQLYTGNHEILEKLFDLPFGVVSRRRDRKVMVTAWSNALVLYSREGMREVVDMFGELGQAFRWPRGWMTGSASQAEYGNDAGVKTGPPESWLADILLPSRVISRPFLSTRPLCNVRLANSLVDARHMKAMRADIVISHNAHKLPGAGYRARYGSEIENWRLAAHLRTIARAYHAGESRVIVVDDDLDWTGTVVDGERLTAVLARHR